MLPEDKQKLLALAFKAREQAYVPYSHFRVGAAVLSERQEFYAGCNIENASYGATRCAEQTAILKAVSEGVRQITALAVVTDAHEFARPCGICRQIMAEFASPDFVLLAAKPDGTYQEFSLAEILPLAFSPQSLANTSN